MNATIRFELPARPKTFTIALEPNAKFLCCKDQGGYPYIYFAYDPNVKSINRQVQVIENGGQFDETKRRYLGSVFLDNDRYTLHVLEAL